MPSGDLEALVAAFRRLAPVPDAALRELAQVTHPRTFARGAWLLHGGQRATHCFFIALGLVRELYIGDDGVEQTRSFVAEGAVTGSLLDLQSGEPSITWIQALEETRTVAFRYADLEAACERFPELHVVLRRAAEALYRQKTRREHEMLALDARARYARWSVENAGLDARVSRRLLASYLGVTPEHLSRLHRSGARTPRRTGRTR